MGVPHKNVEWTEVLKVLTPLLSIRGWGSSEKERSSQGYCAQQICGMTSIVHIKRSVNGVRLLSLTSPTQTQTHKMGNRVPFPKWEKEFCFLPYDGRSACLWQRDMVGGCSGAFGFWCGELLGCMGWGRESPHCICCMCC